VLIVTYSEARKTLATILNRVQEEGAVIIKRADGSLFRLVPELSAASPFEGISTNIHLKQGELAAALEASRIFAQNRHGH